MKRQSIRTIIKAQQQQIEQTPAPEQALVTPTATQPVPTQGVERIKPGYSIRKDLIRECKRIAFEEDRNIYEIIEEGLEMVIKSRKKPS